MVYSTYDRLLSSELAESRSRAQTAYVVGGQAVIMEIVPISLKEANAFIRQYHRHHGVVCGAVFSLGVAVNGQIVGVATVGHPVARMLDDGWTLEVNRTCTDGTKNANSCLYGACRRAAFALGYRKLITYTLSDESGISLAAAGWKCLGEAGGGSWSRPARPRIDKHPLQQKLKWEICSTIGTNSSS